MFPQNLCMKSIPERQLHHVYPEVSGPCAPPRTPNEEARATHCAHRLGWAAPSA